jgi:hypothetical protein
MVTFIRTAYGLKLTFAGSTATQNVAEFLAAAPRHYAAMKPGWRLVVDLRGARVIPPPDVERVATFVSASINEPSRVAMIVSSAVLGMQLTRTFRTADDDDMFAIFDASASHHAEREAELYVR